MAMAMAMSTMSLLSRVSGAVENALVASRSVPRRTLRVQTKGNLTLARHEEQQCSTGIHYSANRRRCWNGYRSCTNTRSIHSRRSVQYQHENFLCHSAPSFKGRYGVIALTQNHDGQLRRHFIHRFSTTNKNSNDENRDSSSSSEKPPPQMPDKDTELRLADLQATITEEYKRGNFTKALDASKDLLKQTQQHFGYNVDHPATASAMNNVGLMHKLLGDFTEARQHYVAAMRIYASVCGRDHASYAMTLHNLGNLNKSQVHFDASLKATERLSLVEAAMEYLEEAYAIRIAELGVEHPHTIATRSAIGSTLAAQVLYQHRMVEDSKNGENAIRKQYVSLNPRGITQQQWRAAEEHLRASLQTAIDNPRGKQIQNNQHRKGNNKFKKTKGKKHFSKQKSTSGTDDASPALSITTLSAASTAQNLAVFLKSLAMTMDEDSHGRKQHLNEAKDLYEKVQQVRTQLLPIDHPDLYATKYSLAELLEVLAATHSTGGDDCEEKLERQRHQEAADELRQEIIDTYDPPDMEQQEEPSTEGTEDPSRPVEVVVEKTKASKK